MPCVIGDDTPRSFRLAPHDAADEYYGNAVVRELATERNDTATFDRNDVPESRTLAAADAGAASKKRNGLSSKHKGGVPPVWQPKTDQSHTSVGCHTLETLSAAVQNAQLTQTELDELVRLVRQQVPAAVTPQLPARKKANDFDTVELAALEFVMDSGEVEKISMRGGRAKCTYSVRCSNISDLRRIPCTVFETDQAGATGPFAGVYFASVRQVGDQYRPHWR